MEDNNKEDGVKIQEGTKDQYSNESATGITEAFWAKQIYILKNSYINSLIIILNIIIYIYSYLSGYDFITRFEHRSELILAGKDYYRLVSSMFLHADVEHLFSNMLILCFVGANVEYDIGHIPYIILYFLSGITGNILTTITDSLFVNYVPSIGASGAVFGIIGAVAVIVYFGRKNLKRGSNFILRLTMMIVLSVYSGFTAQNINNAAHIGGLIGGIIITMLITILGRKKYTMEEWL